MQPTATRRQLLLETSQPGVIAVLGFCQAVASAGDEGSMAVRLVHDHLAEL